MLIPLIVSLFLYLLPNASFGVEPTIRIEYYTVSGATAEEIQADLQRLGPKIESGKRFHGLTTWELAWKYRNARDGRQCWVTSVTTYVTITTVLPKWEPPSGPVNAALVAKWDRYINALTRHEEGHQRYGIEAAHEIDRRIMKLPRYPNCDLLEQAVRKTGNEVLTQAKEKSTRYDVRTRHGATQGAVFP